MMQSASSLGLSLVLATLAVAQHDAHRNAVQEIAAGRLAQAEQEISQADASDPETQFVRMLLALARGEKAQAVVHAQAALDAGLPFTRLSGGPRDLLAPLKETRQYRRWNSEFGNPSLVHGPMVGAVTDRSASFWVRTTEPATVLVRIGDRRSTPVTTGPNSDLTGVVQIDGLAPATKYPYEVFIDGLPVEVQNARFKTFPAKGCPGEFSVAFGGGAGYVPEWERMWDTIGNIEPTAMLMLGDNVYIDQPEHALCQKYCYYRRQSRPEWRRLVASVPMYAIYDDHDFGDNDCIPGPDIELPRWKRRVWRRFCQNWVNPSYGGGEKQPGCWFDFYLGDVHFIMLDGRYYRDLDGGSMLGPVQESWLLETLKNSHGTFKVIASPVPWSEGVKPGSRDPWDGFPEQRGRIFAAIDAHRVDGVFLISADRHRTDLRVTKRLSGYDLYEFESSRLTNRHTHPVIETPGLIWGYNKTCSFGLMRFDTKAEDPRVEFQCVTIDGQITHRFELSKSALQFDR